MLLKQWHWTLTNVIKAVALGFAAATEKACLTEQFSYKSRQCSLLCSVKPQRQAAAAVFCWNENIGIWSYLC
jgi:hypothetical protein